MAHTARNPVRFVRDLPPDHWLTRQLEPDESLREYAEESAVLELTGVLCEEMKKAGLTKKDVADQLGTSRAFVSQVLSGNRNMTLRTLGALLWACGKQVKGLEVVDLDHTVPPVKALVPSVRFSVTTMEGMTGEHAVDIKMGGQHG